MRTIETTATVGADRKLVVELPADVRPGPHRVVIVIEEAVAAPAAMAAPPTLPHPQWPVRDLGRWPYSPTLRREELYGDDGR